MSDSKAPLEKELKYELTKKGYDKLLRTSRKRIFKSVNQINIYFDDPSLQLRKKRIGLRVRIENGGRCTLTLKEPTKHRSKNVPKLKVRIEWESPVPLSKAKRLIKGKIPIGSLKNKPIQILKEHFPEEQLGRIAPLGAVKTLRTFVRAEKNVVFEIDKFKMFDQKFYELEVETHEPARADKVVRAFLKKENIPYSPSTKSKLGRFLDLWKKKRRR